MPTSLHREDLEHLLPPLLRICLEAGQAICDIYRAPGADQYALKDDDSPLTRADLAADARIRAGLAALTGEIPVLSEECLPREPAERRSWRRYWLVDPLDGTREFLDRTGEFTINIALIDGHRPLLGLVYLPLERVAFAGIPGGGAHEYRHRAGVGWDREAIAVRTLPPGQPLEVLCSRRHRGPQLLDCLAWLQRHWGPVQRTEAGSALKFCRLAAGRGDCYPRFAPCSEWDTAAGQALLEAAGGALLGLDGQPLGYNRSDSLDSPHFLAIADPGNRLWRGLLRELLQDTGSE